MTSQTKRLGARQLRAVEALTYSPTPEEIAQGRAALLQAIKSLTSRDDVTRWLDYRLLLEYRSALIGLAAGGLSPQYRLDQYRKTYTLILAADLADTSGEAIDKLNPEDRAFFDEVKSAIEQHGRTR